MAKDLDLQLEEPGLGKSRLVPGLKWGTSHQELGSLMPKMGPGVWVQAARDAEGSSCISPF